MIYLSSKSVKILTREQMGLIISKSKEQWFSSQLFSAHLENAIFSSSLLSVCDCEPSNIRWWRHRSGQYTVLVWRSMTLSKEGGGDPGLLCSGPRNPGVLSPLASQWGHIHKSDLNWLQEGDFKERYFIISYNLGGWAGEAWGKLDWWGKETWDLFLVVLLTVVQL